MNAPRAVLSFVFLVAAVACLDVTNPPPSDSQIRVINAAGGSVTISVDGNVTLQDVKASNVSAMFLPAGTHTVSFQSGTGQTQVDVSSASNEVTTIYTYTPVAGGVAAVVLDTGGIVPTGKSKVRVTLLSQALGNVDVWRVQPDFRTPTRIQTPFTYLQTSPFVQSDSGFWEVYVTAVGSTTKLLSTGNFDVPGRQKRTVVFMDSSGVPILRILPE